MKFIVACLLLGSSVVTLAEEIHPRFIFPSFAKEDLKIPLDTLSDRPDYEEMQAISVEEWRGIMTTGNSSVQDMAAKELLERGDQKTILRLVYALKQGNVAAEEMLMESPSLAATPYLMEDVAHGSLEYHGTLSSGDSGFGDGRVRVAAVRRVAAILFSAPEFAGETSECLKAIGRGGDPSRIQGLTDEARYLLQWWLLNEDAFEAGQWNEVKPLPQEITYGDPKNDTFFRRDESWDPKKQPPFGSPAWELPETFEAWADRIVDPQRRNLDFVALSWDGTKVVEHPARSLDPRIGKGSPLERDPRRTPAPSDLSEQDSSKVDGSWKGTSWAALAGVLILVFSIVQWVRRKSAS
ncbi:MAG: hypothetical protein RLZZ214_4260 [Verrucomicrobiota bacterium]|jgi:hypothetical protein